MASNGDGHDNIETQHGRRQGRPRHKFTPDDLQILNQSFAESPYPDYTTKEELANKLHCPGYTIENWFQNKRARLPAKKRPRVLEARMPYALPVQGTPGVSLQNAQEQSPNAAQAAVLGGAVYTAPCVQEQSPNAAQAAVLGRAVYTAPCVQEQSPNAAQAAVLGGAVYTAPCAQEQSPNAAQAAVLGGAVYTAPCAQEQSPNAAQAAVLGGAVYTAPCAQEQSPNAAQAAVLGGAVYTAPCDQEQSSNAAQVAVLGGAVYTAPCAQERSLNAAQAAVLGGAVYTAPCVQERSPNAAQAAVLGGAVYTAPCVQERSPNAAQAAVLGGAVYTAPCVQERSPNAAQADVLGGAVYTAPCVQERSPNAAQAAVLGGAVYTAPCVQERSPNAAQAAVLGGAVYTAPCAQEQSPNAAQAAVLGGAVYATPPTWEVPSTLYGSWDSGVRGAQEAPSYALENQGNIGGGSFPCGNPGARFVHSFSYTPYFGRSRSEKRDMQPDWPSLLSGVPSAQGAMQQLQEQKSCFPYPLCEEWQQNGWGTHPQQPQQPPDYWQELPSQDQFLMQQNQNTAENKVPFPLPQQRPGERHGDGELTFLQVLSTALWVLSSPTETHEQDTQQEGARDAQF